MNYQEIEKKFEEMLNQKVAELEKEYEKTLYKELGTVALNFDSIKVISTMLNHFDFNNKSTNDVYEAYKYFCSSIEIPYMSNVEFSRFVVKWFGFVIADKKIGGVKYRIFVKVPAVQDEAKVQDEVQDSVQDEMQ
ncbi:hypothetical protein [Petroclostridium xylanilyticum]|uniref:hypothetical protein n=1 Tax=Petroclostridium xylanilyticum TaxID=1792311 RepID=UPI000B998772|nr:hypothetical protein [Petroclostridium xylanilyticum]